MAQTHSAGSRDCEPALDPAVFEISSLGLRRGDRMADWIEHRVQVFDGKKFVPLEQFKSGR